MFTFLPRAGLNRDESIYLFYNLVCVACMLCSVRVRYTQWKQLTNTLRCLFSFYQRWQIYSAAQWHGLYAHVAQLLLMLLITVVVVVIGAGAGAVVGRLWALCCKQSFNSTVQTMRMHCKFKSFYNIYENVSDHFAGKRREKDRERKRILQKDHRENPNTAHNHPSS